MNAEDLLEKDLGSFDVIVTGVRAYKVREDLKGAHERLMRWVARGGTLIVQYNKFELNDEVTVTLTMQTDIGLFGKLGSFPITLTAKAAGKSEVYWR